MEDHEQQYDPENQPCWDWKQTKDILKNSKVTAAALAYYYQIPFDEAVDMPYDAQVLVRAACYSRHKKRYSNGNNNHAIGGKS